MKIINYIVARLREPSTWYGVVAFAGAVAAALGHNEGLAASILAGTAAALTPDKK